MLEALSKLGYVKNIFPFDEEQVQELEVISCHVKNLALEERKNIFSLYPELRILIDKKLQELDLHYRSTNYCFYIEKNFSKNWPLALHQDLNFPDYLEQDHNQKLQEKGLWFRINLDKSDHQNGALKVVPQSHKTCSKDNPIFLDNERGEVILFKPLLFHGSNKMICNQRRRVFQVLCKPLFQNPHK
ncbi:phytanoyl-CoA dioxygenase family protein [Lentisphaera profundi]|uniref:Phytanoyl-CoA dioxygenase family protein n=1 Tax=Lentisphaera profundi TaxID=1658616 RepID=A0ABY7VR43_9BACT|nr:phytanoyl-CoA dioxygenase family protein [Lentisphaera profundi]WDE96666.1 phytanoyl-CoA dioxygenase family protein [Lentisphaera profundi]